jgi:hypothetical protein
VHSERDDLLTSDDLIPAEGRKHIARSDPAARSRSLRSSNRTYYPPADRCPARLDGSDGVVDRAVRAEIARPELRALIAVVEEDVGGLAELEVEPEGAVGIVIFGLVPPADRSRIRWGAAHDDHRAGMDSDATGPRLGMRVWVKTSSNDHPHARPNYESRGFRIFAEQTRPLGDDVS